MNTRSSTKPVVLCVDDEIQVLEGLALHLRRGHEVLLANGGVEALAMLDARPDVAAIISDMRMPGMDGATFLSHARDRHPDAVRILLTGYAEIESAISAVNDGQIYRFLTKPCPPSTVVSTVSDAVEQNRLVRAERELLEDTLRGSVKALVDVLALTNPRAFGRAQRIKARSVMLARSAGITELWPIDVAALMSQVGCITLQDTTIDKMFTGGELSEAERQAVGRLPLVGERLLGEIPRLDTVRAILIRAGRPRPVGPLDVHDVVAVGAEAIRITTEIDLLESRGIAGSVGADLLRQRGDSFDDVLLGILARLLTDEGGKFVTKDLPLAQLEVGMVLTEDVKMPNGMLLVGRGYEVTHGFLERVRNMGDHGQDAIVKIAVPAA
jgi:CheY-like chemotaxis protein